ncbi:ras guanine nucleotide exchange factor domain-containing protein, partial [Cokeromyces recurvatus]|uniref:ras guanine nucleotide exchange factor domain-containing protein n=1 Tax=Cokeromyces recurvatus TaxID=90255 RepID=UPI0022202979
MSYDLYIEVLLSAINEFKQLKFINQSVVDNNLSSLFYLAHTCLRHARSISSNCTIPSSPPARPNYQARNIEQKKSSLYQSDQTRYVHNEGKTFSSVKITSSQTKSPYKQSVAMTVSHTTSLNTVKALLSLTTPNSENNGIAKRESYYNSTSTSLSSTINNVDDNIFLLSNSTIDPYILITVQTSNSDNSLSSNNIHSSYLPRIPQAPLITTYKLLQRQVEDANEQNQLEDLSFPLNRVRNIYMTATTVPTILQFSPVLIAYQLTLIDSTIFRNIPVNAILTHTPKTPHPAIVASTDFFNYLTRFIEHAILLQQDASSRAEYIHHWIKVAQICFELKNYQTLKAVISAFGTPPIGRLKRSWQFVPKKSLNLLEALSDFMSEASNYANYRAKIGLLTLSVEEDEIKSREVIQGDTFLSSSASTEAIPTVKKKLAAVRKNSFSEPTVPFLGVFIHDMTYLAAALLSREGRGETQNNRRHNSEWVIKKENDRKLIMIQQDTRVSELLRLFKSFQQSPPYSPHLSAACMKDLNKNRKRKLSHALKKSPIYFQQEDYYYDGELSIEMQQCLITQYLLTRSWVSEKTVDELSLLREPTTKQPIRNHSVPDLQPSIINSKLISSSSLIQTPSSTISQEEGIRNSSGSLTSHGDSSLSSNNDSRPVSIENEIILERHEEAINKKLTMNHFWLFGRKSVDQGLLKASTTESLSAGLIHRSPRHFSFDELNGKDMPVVNQSLTNNSSTSLLEHNATLRMNRESPLLSATSIFRKDFWKSNNHHQQNKAPLIIFNSDPSMISSSSEKICCPSFDQLHEYTLSPPHPLDLSPSSSTAL